MYDYVWAIPHFVLNKPSEPGNSVELFLAAFYDRVCGSEDLASTIINIRKNGFLVTHT